MFSNFQFCEGEIRMWKAYNIGQAIFVNNKEVVKETQP